ncbi:MAG TPA: hypothetical protein VIJ75_11510 [Hanamia sp.]
MQNHFQIPEVKSSLLEKFGIYYLKFFWQKDSTHRVFDFTDEDLTKKVSHITRKGIVYSCIVGIVCIFPTIWINIYLSGSPFLIHYGWVAGVSAVCIGIELYLLFLIALKAVYEVSEIINMRASKSELLQGGVFSVPHILSRTALELPDPELKILGIDPFKRISKKNLLILGLLYKAKIFLTNLVTKNLLLLTVGQTVEGVSISYFALVVECFWNGAVIIRVVHEARLRLFGFALANQIAEEVLHEKMLTQLSPLAKTGCLRAIGNVVVMAQNYHPNMMILLIRFQQLLQLEKEDKYDDWNLFLETLKSVSEKERNFLLDLFTVSAAFDGKVSHLEEENLRSVYGHEYDLYYKRLMQLTDHLKKGKLNAALSLCRLDFVAG